MLPEEEGVPAGDPDAAGALQGLSQALRATPRTVDALDGQLQLLREQMSCTSLLLQAVEDMDQAGDDEESMQDLLLASAPARPSKRTTTL